VKIAYRLVGYDRETERQVASYVVPPAIAADAKQIAGVAACDDGLGDYPLDATQAREVGRLLGIEIDPKACDYLLEPQVTNLGPRKYPVPAFLSSTTQAAYERWLHWRAIAHVKRDKKRGNTTATNEAYKTAIHKAVLESEGIDYYTGESLDWSLLSKYRNCEAKETGRHYKQKFACLPSVDHVGNGLGPADFKIRAWRTNDAKNDLSQEEFVALCRRVISHFDAQK
jgi:hypothetical protein